MKRTALMIASEASMVDQFSRENIRLLQQLGYEVHFACDFKKYGQIKGEKARKIMIELEEAHIKCVHLPMPRKLTDFRRLRKSSRILSYYIRIHQFQVIHCQSFYGGMIARKAVSKLGETDIKVLYTTNGFEFYRGAPLRKWFLYYPIERHFSKYTDLIIVVNHEDYKTAKKKLQAKQVIYIPGRGLDTGRFIGNVVDRCLVKQQLGISKEKKIVVNVGELNSQKNCKVALKAFVKAKCPNAVLLFCGKGPMKKELQNMVMEYHMSNQVLFLDVGVNIVQVLLCADVFVSTSKQEGLPIPLMEAMAAGLPVVCSKVRGNRDLVIPNKGGYLCETMDVEQYARRIRELLNSHALSKQYGRYNRKRMRLFATNTVMMYIEEIYQQLV